MNSVQKQLKDMVVSFLVNVDIVEESTIDNTVLSVSGLPMFMSLTKTEIDEVVADIKANFQIKLDVGALLQEKGHKKWFQNKKAELSMAYWERYKKYLLFDKGFSTHVVNTMDDVLDTLTDLLGDPSRDVAYNRRGLIIGDVQSGKTSNYTGLICKAVDSGYKVVVLLTGTIERLRQQTQERIDEGFVGADSEALMKKKTDDVLIGVSKYDSSFRPMVLTSTRDDFKTQNASNLGFDLRNINGSVIFVVKKNSAILKRLNKWLGSFNQNADQKIQDSILIVDDEADNASVNTKGDDSPTAINEQIRDMISKFSKSSYVGFTATPFANIFIDPDNYNEKVAEDLFPKDYVYSLNAPSNYIGARNIFGIDAEHAYMLKYIDMDINNPNSIATVLPISHKSSYIVQTLPDDLKTAIESFVLANAIEDLRGMSNNHRSMLINASRFTAVQEQISGHVNDYLKDIQSACRVYSALPSEQALQNDIIAKLKETYEEVYSEIEFSWEQLQTTLHKSIAGIFVQTINQRNGKNLRYDQDPNGLRIIAVGGMSLSRGLTLEGLVISYFYRNSKMYDTLMQMGRWFGYRKGYDNICRIWMTEESIEWYRYISDATDELRLEIKRYEDTGLTPMDFGLRVRADLTTLIVTAYNKMRSAENRECLVSLSSECIETHSLYVDDAKNNRNYEAVKTLVESAINDGGQLVGTEGRSKYGILNVKKDHILDLLEQIDISPKNEQFNTNAIKSFIIAYKGSELEKWDVAFATGESEKPVDFGYDIEYYHPKRTYSIENEGKILSMSGARRRLGGAQDGRFGLDQKGIDSVQALIENEKRNPSQKDYFKIERKPLLVIYAVELGDYRPSSTGCEIKKTDPIHDSLKKHTYYGFGIGIPKLTDQETKYARYTLNKKALQLINEGVEEWDYDGDDID